MTENVITETSSASIASNPSLISIREEEIRCTGINDGSTCGKLLTKFFTYICVDDKTRAVMKEKNLSVSEVVNGIEIKVGMQTKCTRCKSIENTLKVI